MYINSHLHYDGNELFLIYPIKQAREDNSLLPSMNTTFCITNHHYIKLLNKILFVFSRKYLVDIIYTILPHTVFPSTA